MSVPASAWRADAVHSALAALRALDQLESSMPILKRHEALLEDLWDAQYWLHHLMTALVSQERPRRLADVCAEQMAFRVEDAKRGQPTRLDGVPF